MNILILSEVFSKGGLETHIETYYQALKQNHNLYFGFGRYQKTHYLDGAVIYDDFNFSSGANIKQFLNDVEKIIRIINDHHIDVIHAHPFYSLFPAIFAANITNTKLVYTYHGRGSINFVSYANDTILYEFAMESFISKIFCVSQTGVSWLSDFKKDQAVYLPNLIDEQKFFVHQSGKQKRWALFSRLDLGKFDEIIKFLEYLPSLDICFLDIYGDGSEKEKICCYVEENNLSDKVAFKEYSNDVSKTLEEGRYTGVIGIGRVVLESLTMNYPTILIGYGKIAGMVDAQIFHQIKNINFVPTESSNILCNDLNSQIKKINKGECSEYQIRNLVVREFGVHRISEYIDEINYSSFAPVTILDQIYKEICNLGQTSEYFYQSYSVFQILARYIGFYTNNLGLKNMINLYQKNYEVLQSVSSVSIVDYSELYTRIGQLEKQLLKERNTSFLTLLKRDVHKLFYKIKKRCMK